MLEADSPVLTASIQPLPDESKAIITSYGGLTKFLLGTEVFETLPGSTLIGLKDPLGEDGTSSTANDSFPTLADSMKEEVAKNSKQQQLKTGLTKKGRMRAKTSQANEQSDTQSLSSSGPVSASSSVGSSPAQSPMVRRKELTSSKQLDTERDDTRTASKLRLRLEKETLLAEDDMLDTPVQASTAASSNSNSSSKLSAEDREKSGKTDSSDKVQNLPVLDGPTTPVYTGLDEPKDKQADKLVASRANAAVPHSANKLVPYAGEPTSNGSQVSLKSAHEVVGGVVCDVVSVHVQTNSSCLSMADKGVSTYLMPSVDSFKERYEEALKEKKSLQDKLEHSEDRRVQLQNQHGLDMERATKKARQEVTQVCVCVLVVM